MSRTTKILLIIGAIGAIGCCAAFALAGYAGMRVAKNVSVDTASAAKTAHEITDYTLPGGYQEQMGMAMFGLKMAIIGEGTQPTGGTTSTMIALVELPVGGDDSDASADAVESSVRDRMGGSIDGAKTVDERDVTIRGEKTKLVVTEGTRSGDTVRQATATFTSKADRPALLMVIGPADGWDDDAVDAFIRSMK